MYAMRMVFFLSVALTPEKVEEEVAGRSGSEINWQLPLELQLQHY